MMDTFLEKLPPNERVVVDRVMIACQRDDRIVAAFLVGSYAKGTNDVFSDLDIFVIIGEADFDEFCADRATFIRLLGEPVSLENFEVPYYVGFVLDNEVEGDLIIWRESQLATNLAGPYLALIDKRGILRNVTVNPSQPKPEVQAEKLRRMIFWFWHDWMHFTTALGRGQLWWAQGQLETLRGYCVSLLRFQNDFNDHEAGGEHYFKIELAVPVEQLSRLKASLGPLERGHLYQAGLSIAQVYQDLARTLAKEHGIAYPDTLESLMMKRFKELDQ